MHKQNITNKRSVLFVVIGIISIALCVLASFKHFQLTTYKWAYELVTVLLSTIAIYIFIRYSVANISYLFIHDDIVFKKSIGKKEIVLLSVPVENVITIMKKKEMTKDLKQKYKIKLIYKICADLFNRNVYYMIIKTDKNNCSAVKFQPSEEFYQLIKDKIKKSTV